MKASRFVRHSRRVLGVLVLVPLCFSPGALGQERAQDLFQQALRMERVTGDLEGAIGVYQQVVETGDKPLGARALIRIAESYEKLGRQGAREAYARVIEEFGDQMEQAALARERLAELDQPTAEPTAASREITTRRLHEWVLGEAIPFAITPDGGELVYSDLWFGNLAIRELVSGRSRTLTQDSSWSTWGASVSPDGRTVSYLLAEPTVSSLHLVGIDGSEPRALYREAGCAVSSHEWTSAGGHIVAMVHCGGDLQVLRISVRDGGAEKIKDLVLGEFSLNSISPDDRYLAYEVPVEKDGGNFDIRLLALDGGSDASLVSHPANDMLLGWMPDTDEVLFRSDRSGTMDLWALEVRGGSPVGRPRLVRRDMGDVVPRGFTEEGGLVYSNYLRWFSTGVAPFDLGTGAIDMESRVELLGSNLPATWSPDGEYLAFIPELEGPNPAGGPYDRPLHIRHLATGEERALVSHLQTRNQRWSPDGRSILLCGRDPKDGADRATGGIYLVDVETGQTTQVLELNPETRTAFWSDLGAEWSKDGSAIIYSVFDNSRKEGRLAWRDLASGQERELFRDPTLTSRQFALSPDGTRLVFALRSAAEGYSTGIHSGGRLLILDLDGGDVREFHQIAEPGRVWSLQWTPDGEHVLFTKRTEDSNTAVWRVAVTGGTAERLWTFEEPHFNAYINLSPDGSHVTYTTYHQEFEVWMMENLREAVRALGGNR